MEEKSEADRWRERSRRKVIWLWAAYVSLASLAVYGLAWTIYPNPGLTLAQWAAKWLNDKVSLGVLLGLSDTELTALFRDRFAPAVGLLIAAAVALARSWRVASFLHERYFPEFDSTLFGKIRRPMAADPLRGPIEGAGELPSTAMEWIPPHQGVRKEIWRRCEGFVRKATEKGGARTQPTSPYSAFSWSLLVGQAGSGKSRTAVHCAREYARRKSFNEGVAAHRLPRLGAHLRLSTPWLRPKPNDPWDAGAVVFGHTANDAHGLRERLSTWRPRRPTVLILDDPPEDWIAATIQTLARSASDRRKPFRHPVRLFVVNQTIPAVLALRRINSADARRFDGWKAPELRSSHPMLSQLR